MHRQMNLLPDIKRGFVEPNIPPRKVRRQLVSCFTGFKRMLFELKSLLAPVYRTLNAKRLFAVCRTSDEAATRPNVNCVFGGRMRLFVQYRIFRA